METAENVEAHGLLVLRHGRVVVAGCWALYTSERRRLLYSLSMTFTGIAAGVAVADGLLDLDETVLGCFPALDTGTSDPRSRNMLVRHLAPMSTGHLSDMWEPVVQAGGEEPVAAFLDLAPERDPGTVFAYHQPATYTRAQPSLHTVRVDKDSDGWSVMLVNGGVATRMRFVQDAWTTTDVGMPMAVSGGWLDDGSLRLAVVMLETPHRLLLTCRLRGSTGGGTFEASWATQPLHGGPLHAMRAPD